MQQKSFAVTRDAAGPSCSNGVASTVNAYLQVDKLLKAVSSAKQQLQEQQLLHQQHQTPLPSQGLAPLLDSLIKSNSKAAAPAYTSSTAMVSEAARIQAAAHTSMPVSSAGLQHAVSNVSSCSRLADLQRVLLNLPTVQPLQASATASTAAGVLGQQSGLQPGSACLPVLQQTAPSLTAATFDQFAKSESTTTMDLISKLEAAKAAAGSPAKAAQLSTVAGSKPSSHWAVTAAIAADEDAVSDQPVDRIGSGTSVTTIEPAVGRLNSNSQLSAKAQQMYMLMNQINQLQQQQQAAAAAVKTESTDIPSGMDVDMLDTMVKAAAAPAAAPAAAARASQQSSAGCSTVEVARFEQVHMQLQRVLEDAVNTKKQAATCIREAVLLGLLPDFLLRSLQHAVTPTSSEIAAAAAKVNSSTQQPQQQSSAVKRPRNVVVQAEVATTAAEHEPAKKLHRLACSTDVNSAASADATVAAATAEPEGQLDKKLSNASTASEAAGAALASQGTTVKQQEDEQQQGAAEEVPSEVGGSAAAAADLPRVISSDVPEAAAAAEEDVPSSSPVPDQHAFGTPAARDLFLRTVMVMSRSQRLCKYLANTAIQAVTEAQAARQITMQNQQVQTLDVQGLTALHPIVQQLKQQLIVAKAAISAKHQALLQLQQDSQTTVAAHALQLENIGQAVRHIMAMANDESMRKSDRQKLVDIAADILRTVVKQ